MRTAAVYINEPGRKAAEVLKQTMPDLEILTTGEKEHLHDLIREIFSRYDGIIMFCASGIAVRVIAPMVKSKYEDPAVVVVDNGMRHAISLLSGHEGGANMLAARVGVILGAVPVVTTATEARKDLVLGIGSRKGVETVQVLKAVDAFLSAHDIPLKRIRTAATIGRKCTEPGIVEAFEKLDIYLTRVTAHRIRTFGTVFEQSAACRHFPLPAVAEPSAILAARDGRLIIPKEKFDGVTLAMAEERKVPLGIDEENELMMKEVEDKSDE